MSSHGGKVGKSSFSKVPAGRGYVSSQEGIHTYIYIDIFFI